MTRFILRTLGRINYSYNFGKGIFYTVTISPRVGSLSLYCTQILPNDVIALCLLQVGSYSYDMTKMLFKVTRLTFIQKQSIVLDYKIAIRNLRPEDQIFNAGALGNYSLAGFEMVSTFTNTCFAMLYLVTRSC